MRPIYYTQAKPGTYAGRICPWFDAFWMARRRRRRRLGPLQARFFSTISVCRDAARGKIRRLFYVWGGIFY